MFVRSQIAPYSHTINTPSERAASPAASAPRHSGGTVKRMVGMLGGEINRKAAGLSGRVLEQKKSRRPAPDAEFRKHQATALAVQMTQDAESLLFDFRLHHPYFLTASFAGRTAENKFLQALEWMLDNGAEVIVTFEAWMQEIMQAFATTFIGISSSPGLAPHTHIWKIRNPLNTADEQLLNSITIQPKYSQELC